MAAQDIPIPDSLEPALVTPYSITTTPLTIDPYAIAFTLVIPSGTTATVQTGYDGEDPVTYDATGVHSIHMNGRALANEFVISRASGSGTILALVGRVAGRATTNA